MSRILVVEDESAIAELISINLRHAGFEVTIAATAEQAQAAVDGVLPDLIVLDEATAHLDSTSEAAVQEALAEALAGRTSVVIAHRLSTVADADQILVLDQGRLAEQGSHPALLRKGGLYAEMWNRQQAEGEDLSEAAE